MRAVNHALTGSLIGLTIGEPLVAIPVALLSHYICDALPHYAQGIAKDEEIRSPAFRRLLYGDAALCAGLVVVLAVLRPENWLLASVCAFVAAAPDFVSVKRFVRTNKRLSYNPNRYEKFADSIQWFERPIGAVVEAAWFLGCLSLLVAAVD